MMTAEQFTYWLQGYAELNEQPPSPEQWQMIRDHLALVFNKVTPNYAPRWPQNPPPASPTIPNWPLDMRPTCISIVPPSARTIC